MRLLNTILLLVISMLFQGSIGLYASVHSDEHKVDEHKADKPEKKKGNYIALPKVLFDVPKVEMPQLISMPKPEYPHEYEIRGISGQATVELLVTAEGKAKYIGVISCSAKPFGEALVEAVKHAEFVPGTANGVPTAVKIKLPYDFKIKTDEEE